MKIKPKQIWQVKAVNSICDIEVISADPDQDTWEGLITGLTTCNNVYFITEHTMCFENKVYEVGKIYSFPCSILCGLNWRLIQDVGIFCCNCNKYYFNLIRDEQLYCWECEINNGD